MLVKAYVLIRRGNQIERPQHLCHKQFSLRANNCRSWTGTRSLIEWQECSGIIILILGLVCRVLRRQPSLREVFQRVGKVAAATSRREIAGLADNLDPVRLYDSCASMMCGRLTPLGIYVPSTTAPGLMRGSPSAVFWCRRKVSCRQA